MALNRCQDHRQYALEAEAIDVIFGVLGDIAPEVDEAGVDQSVDLTEQLDLDSMDYLTWLVGISQATGIDIPQRHVSRVLTIDGATAYLVEHGSGRPAPASPGERSPVRLEVTHDGGVSA